MNEKILKTPPEVVFKEYQMKHTGFAQIFEQDVLLDEEFWRDRVIPDEIVIGTGSLRKAMMVTSLLWVEYQEEHKQSIDISTVIPTEKPEMFPTWMREHVFNGDETIEIGTRLFLGYFHGVKVYLFSAGGETEKNDQPKIQAVGKAWSAWKEDEKIKKSLRSGEKKTVYVGWDTIESLMGSDGTSKKHGKPANDPSFPKKVDDDPEYEHKVKAYDERYLQENYIPGVEIDHLTAIAVLASCSGLIEGDEILQTAVLLQYVLSHQYTLDDITLDHYAGGAGITQQILSRTEWYLSLSPKEQLLLICQIMGVPFYQTMTFIINHLEDFHA